MPDRKEWIVTVSGERPIAEVAKDLKAAGLTVDQVLSEIGSIIAVAPSNIAKKARSIKGVADVSPGGSVEIGPPDSDETW